MMWKRRGGRGAGGGRAIVCFAGSRLTAIVEKFKISCH